MVDALPQLVDSRMGIIILMEVILILLIMIIFANNEQYRGSRKKEGSAKLDWGNNRERY